MAQHWQPRPRAGTVRRGTSPRGNCAHRCRSCLRRSRCRRRNCRMLSWNRHSYRPSRHTSSRTRAGPAKRHSNYSAEGLRSRCTEPRSARRFPCNLPRPPHKRAGRFAQLACCKRRRCKSRLLGSWSQCRRPHRTQRRGKNRRHSFHCTSRRRPDPWLCRLSDLREASRSPPASCTCRVNRRHRRPHRIPSKPCRNSSHRASSTSRQRSQRLRSGRIAPVCSYTRR